jgi:transposase
MKTAERDMARKLRREGLSMREIERRLGVARSTVSLWVREIELTDHQLEELQARGVSARTRARRIYYRARRRMFQDEGRVVARNSEPLHAAGCMLFWAEGSRNRNSTRG